MKKHPIYPPIFGGTLGFQYNKCSLGAVSGPCICINCWCSMSDHSVFIYRKKKLGGDVKEQELHMRRSRVQDADWLNEFAL